ncbi:uncharacterized protein LOC117526632 [Thalassophryne amazonica]|uniref:uncharacterized protein LOC117526632 n=1 Tax=Thalassophryne amazonica TaxID=390379 RepID=UPI001470EF72|nr:uncharacterized protein LOC117526632 [Thalassophryne amazonica]
MGVFGVPITPTACVGLGMRRTPLDTRCTLGACGQECQKVTLLRNKRRPAPPTFVADRSDRTASLCWTFVSPIPWLEVDVCDIAIIPTVVIVRFLNAEPSADCLPAVGLVSLPISVFRSAGFVKKRVDVSLLLDVTSTQCQAHFGLLASSILANQMEKLQDLSQSELQELLDNSERVESMALESDEIQNIQLEREMALASNRSLAEQNLDMKPRLESQKEMLGGDILSLRQLEKSTKNTVH